MDILRQINNGCVGEQHPTNFIQPENLRTFGQLKHIWKKLCLAIPDPTRLEFSDCPEIVRLSSLLMFQVCVINPVFTIDARTTFSEQVLLLSMTFSDESENIHIL